MARWVLRMCDRFHCLPSALLAEDTGLLQLLALEEMGGGGDGEHRQYHGQG